MMIVKVCLDSEKFTKKPGDKRVISQISQRIGKEQVTAQTEQIAGLIGEQGHTFCPAIFQDGKRAADRFAEMQLFRIDFDDEISYEDAKNM